VFVLTDTQNGLGGGRLWRSEDFGRYGSWEDVTDKLAGALPGRRGRGV
jgi:hypothetical protein